MSGELPTDADALGTKAREYLAMAQSTVDLALRDELLKLCEQMLREAATARQAASTKSGQV